MTEITGWFAEYHDRFDVTVPPIVFGAAAATRVPASFGLALAPAIDVEPGLREAGEFAMVDLEPQIGIGATRVAASFELAAALRLDTEAGERYDRSAVLNLPAPVIEAAGIERYSATTEITAQPVFAMSAADVAARDIGLTLSAAIGMDGEGIQFLGVEVTGTQIAFNANTITLPPHNIGDTIIILNTRWTGVAATPPAAGGTVPVWQTAATGTWLIAYCVASAKNHTSGTWSTTDTFIAIVLTGAYEFPIGATAQDTGFIGAGLPAPVPAVNLVDTGGNSAVLHIAHRQMNSTLSGLIPAGYTTIGTAADVIVLSKDLPNTSAPAINIPLTTTSTVNYRSATLEVRATPQTQPYLLDAFDRPNDATLGPNWTIRTGTFRIYNQTAYPTNTSATGAQWMTPMATDNIKVTAQIRPGTAFAGQIMIGGPTGDTNATLRFTASSLSLNSTGAIWAAGSSIRTIPTISIVDGDLLSLERVNWVYTVKHNGITILTYDDNPSPLFSRSDARFVGIGGPGQDVAPPSAFGPVFYDFKAETI